MYLLYLKNPFLSFQAGKENKLFNNDPCANIAHKILIPIVLLLTAGAAVPIYLLKYEKLSHTCTDPFRVMFVTDTQDPKQFTFDLYSTVVTVFTYVLPILILPLALPIATLRTCIARQCCVTRYKQPIGELIMTTIVGMLYLGTIVGVVLPRIDEMLQLESVSDNFVWLLSETIENKITQPRYAILIWFCRLSLDLLPSYGRLATTRWDPSSISWPTPPFGMVLPNCFVAKNTTMVSMITMRKLKCLWLPSPQSKLYYQPNPKWESKNRHLFFFSKKNDWWSVINRISAFLTTHLFKLSTKCECIEYEDKKQLRSCKFSRHDDSHIFFGIINDF